LPAITVVEGVGDHGCEYMTGGLVVVLGTTGRNFAAGMSGGVAYVFDEDGAFTRRCNKDLVELETLEGEDEIERVRELVEEHQARTGSPKALELLDSWRVVARKMVKVVPSEYRRALADRADLPETSGLAAAAIAAATPTRPYVSWREVEEEAAAHG
jgi:glutamate synthase (NADPH/NADH) large chain